MIEPKVQLPTVQCKNCSIPPTVILLPYPNPPEISQDRPLWPKADWQAWLACHECGFVLQYSAQDVRWGAFSKSFLNQLHQHPNFFAFDTECVEPSCKAPIRVHFYTGSGTTVDDVMNKFWKTIARVECANGHPANGQLPAFHREVVGPI